ncbi:GDP-mannose 4,6-dehydratase [Desulfatiferula olefinivorans]
MDILITGITGMAGSHMAEYLLNRGDCRVHGTLRWRSSHENIAGIEDRIMLHSCELRDPHAVNRLLQTVRPDVIFHFAAQSSVQQSWNSPQDTIVNNITPELNLFESIRFLELYDTTLLVPGSSEEYGLVYESELPVSELNPLRPMSPYAVSKVTQSALGFQYFQNYGLKIIRTRSFNHTGPKRSDMFVTSSFAKQIAEIELGLKPPVIKVGNLSARRDFSDIRDIVRAYDLAVRHGVPGEIYNIGSGISYGIHEILDMYLSMSNTDIGIEEDPERLRPSDVPELRCDYGKFHAATGWRPTIPIERTLRDLLDDWRKKLRRVHGLTVKKGSAGFSETTIRRLQAGA